ncbi:multiubiquitin domain-containing protein [Herbaspirillum aquaticum]|uniref:multiubiquitin domain-containing protein n=1 Tax=Herbaspirillum aquaticum TaxID=568783 RepID=UPI0024DE107A|nr:multiubiquitin domain-containing protein [Herbaspirillum aquaticum]
MKYPTIDDVGDAIREDRPLREAAAYRILFGLEGLSFRHIDVPDPVPTGRQILESAGLDRRGDYLLFAILASGDFEDIRLDETVDLRGKGAERFIAFKSDRDFKFKLNDREMAWGHAELLGSVLYELAEPSPEEAIFFEVRGGEGRLIEPDDRINLDEPGIERFITAPRPNKGYVILVNSVEETVPDKHVTFEQVVKLSHPNAPPETNVKFSMTYRNAASLPHAGELGEGGSVEVKKHGSIFNVTRTVQS